MKKNLISGFTGFLVLLAPALNAQQWNGLTLYSNNGSTLGYLVDTNSTVVKTWTFTGNTGYSTHMLPGGTLTRGTINQGNALVGGGMTGRIQKYSYAGALLWDYVYSSTTYCLHHDHFPLPNGNVLVISYDVKTNADIKAVGGISNLSTVRSEKIMELQPVGTNSAIVVWEWKLWDHLVQNTDNSKSTYQTAIADHPELMHVNYAMTTDWLHMNGIDYNPLLDQIVVSSHNLNEWYIIDHSTTTAEAATHTGGNAGKGGDFLYRWGNPGAYSAAGNKILNVTHDSHWIPEDCPNGGGLAGINNKGVTTPSSKTTADQVLTPRVNYNYTLTSGSAFTPTNYTSRHVSGGYSSNMGSSQEFPNGNQMICLALSGTIYEIDASNNILWTKTTAGTCSQSKRYSPCYINNAAPAQPTITASGNNLNSTPATTYQWYVNGNLISNANAQTFTPLQNGIYVVAVTDSNNCVKAYSAGLTHTVLNTVGLADKIRSQTEVNIFPNPSSGLIYIQADEALTAEHFILTVSDLTGKMVLKANDPSVIDISELQEGLYILNIQSTSGKQFSKKLTHIK